MFETNYSEILTRLDQVDPVKYGWTRNFSDGVVSRLSPYISRGVISTRQVFRFMLEKKYEFSKISKFIQELAWRDYWQQVWIVKGDLINEDLKSSQQNVAHHEIPQSLWTANTGIKMIDEKIKELYETGYMHNHMRMYVAAIACNIAQSHWNTPARWMYYHLLDADWASNALSWQWVAGSNSHKKYIANQENINKYFYSDQKDTFLDLSYDRLAHAPIPGILAETIKPVLETRLPTARPLNLDENMPVFIYNFYNLDPVWRGEEKANRILLLEPSHFKTYPVSEKTMNFILGLAENIPGMQIFVGEFRDLKDLAGEAEFFFKEHPLSKHYQGHQDPRDWMFDVQGYYPSFFAFWKRCLKTMN